MGVAAFGFSFFASRLLGVRFSLLLRYSWLAIIRLKHVIIPERTFPIFVPLAHLIEEVLA